jgi:tRNA threonylcarbamoyladenosine biosynthesis protein TsaB
VRCLGIETSSRRGSVALVQVEPQGVQVVGVRFHQEANRHGERILPLVDELLREAGWSLTSIDRVGVGVGPGSFTGLRIGVALSQGIGLGLGCPVVGVSSLRAMARAAPPHAGPTAALLDARRGEYFLAVYDTAGMELHAPHVIPQLGAEQAIVALGGDTVRIVGEPAAEWGHGFSSDASMLPTATATATLAAELDPADAPALPVYVRAADAVKPSLPPSPLAAG